MQAASGAVGQSYECDQVGFVSLHLRIGQLPEARGNGANLFI
jgi:hypothetical protein